MQMLPEFPIMWPYKAVEERELKALNCPRGVPWEMVLPHEQQARRNHDQSLRRLAERGGLSLSELVAVLEDRKWHSMPKEEALAVVLRLIEDHRAAQQT